MKRFFVLALTLSMALSLAACGSASAAVNYPIGEITFIIPNGPGGGNDLITRSLIPSLTETLGVNVIPSNRSESAGAVAAMNLMTAAPNGETLYFNSQTLITAAMSTIKAIDLNKFQPVAQVVEDTGNILVRPNEFKDINEFVKVGKIKTLKIAVNGKTSVWGMAAKQFEQTTGIEFQYVIYSEGGPACLAALAQGEVDAVIENASGSQAMVDSGAVVPLACMGDTRVSAYPDTPTLKEKGIDMSAAVWRGVFTTAGVSEEILDKLDKAFAAAVKSQEFTSYCKNASLAIRYRDHKEFTEFVNSEIEFYKKSLGV